LTKEFKAPEDYSDKLVQALVKTVADVSTVTAADGSQFIVLHSYEICEVLLDMLAWQAAATKTSATKDGQIEIIEGFCNRFAIKLKFHREAYDHGMYGSMQIIDKGTRQ
jgi:hypothetical protein